MGAFSPGAGKKQDFGALLFDVKAEIKRKAHNLVAGY